ncbi:MAG TPA: hypothetical protein VHA30_02005 [Patescibacteria group bacterium]|nr:hypothetical protein [Patescibacteria group bacterium]
MKALSTLWSAVDHGPAIAAAVMIGLLPVILPQYALAAELQTQGQSAQVFEIKIADPDLLQNQTNNDASLQMAEVKQSDPLVVSLQSYLEDHSSPLADSAATLVDYPNWKRALAISLVESHMCLYTPKVKTKAGWVESHNCSGIGGDSYRVYNSYVDWFVDMNNLLGQPNYINRPIEKFINYYVQPGSANWLYGVKKTEKELTALEQQAQVARQQAAQTASAAPSVEVASSLVTFAD